ncbi:MAG: class I SAM-dependent methyltransferase [Myxococcota bacterium]|nr:class I SAM-dependent methyltransferase [Myxococcota bacterium]
MSTPYSESAALYDRIYATKDYRAEVETLRVVIEQLNPRARTLLEVACGTGSHLALLAQWFDVEGVDLSPDMLAVARAKLPDARLSVGDMRTLALGRQFDIVTCLFSSIGYVRSPDELDAAVAAMAAHLTPGGLLIVEPWFEASAWRTGSMHGSLVVDEPDLKVARMVISSTRDRFAVTPMHHLVARPSGVTHFIETHELFLATADEYRAAFTSANLDVTHRPDVLPRTAWIGRR